jgi:hypothetical protein
LVRPTTTEESQTATNQQGIPIPATQKVKPVQPTITENDVRLRAYELYLERGAVPGDAVSDWLRAERELLAD